MKLIATQTLTSAGPSISFSSIPNNFTDLYVLLSLRMARSTTGGAVKMRINGSDTNFSWRALQGNGSGVSNDSQTDSSLFWTDGANQTANTFGNIAIYIPNYAGSTNKSISVDAVDENNATESYQRITAGLWSNTAAITSLSWSDNSASDWVAGTTASLYGMGGAGDGWAPKATGGVISKSGNYYVHTFTASGTFTPTANLTDVEYLVVGGGGGGSNTFGGHAGGGAGGYRLSVTGENSGGGASAEAKLSLTSGTAYTVTVGAGGTGAPAVPSVVATNGVSSSFSSITSLGGGYAGNDTNSLTGGAGGAGGGGGGAGSSFGVGGAGTTNQGFNGGAGRAGTNGVRAGGAGGGAGSIGLNASNGVGGNGGGGLSSSITGTSIARAGGGGGGTLNGTVLGVGTAGGGSAVFNSNGASGTSNTGGGGGGSDFQGSGDRAGGNGGSGIVVVRYLA